MGKRVWLVRQLGPFLSCTRKIKAAVICPSLIWLSFLWAFHKTWRTFQGCLLSVLQTSDSKDRAQSSHSLFYKSERLTSTVIPSGTCITTGLEYPRLSVIWGPWEIALYPTPMSVNVLVKPSLRPTTIPSNKDLQIVMCSFQMVYQFTLNHALKHKGRMRACS